MTIDTAVFVRICKEKEENAKEIGITLIKRALAQTGRCSTYNDEYIEGMARRAYEAEKNNGVWPGMKQAHPFISL